MFPLDTEMMAEHQVDDEELLSRMEDNKSKNVYKKDVSKITI